MGFFDALRRVLHQDAGHRIPGDLADAWGLTETGQAAAGGPPAEASAYDRVQWRKKLKRILDELPGSRPEWAELMTEARALDLDPAWVEHCQREEFGLLIRRAVSDRRFTDEEHARLDLARDLINIPEPEAEAALNAIIAEAESFFGEAVKDE